MQMYWQYLTLTLYLLNLMACAHVGTIPIKGSVSRSEFIYTEQITEKIEIIGISRYPNFNELIKNRTHIVIELELSNGGQLLQTRILHSSGNPAIDAAMLDIIRYSAPYPPFPDEMKMDRLMIQKRWLFMPQ